MEILNEHMHPIYVEIGKTIEVIIRIYIEIRITSFTFCLEKHTWS